MFGKTKTVGMENLKRPKQTYSTWKQCKNTNLKSTWPIGKGDPFAYFKASAGEAKNSRDFPKGQRQKQKPFFGLSPPY